MHLHLGVLDIPYVDAEGITTGDVAEILEEKYGVLGAFMEVHGEEVATIMAEAVAGTIESLVAGVSISPFAAAMPQIETLMKRWFTSQEVERVGLPGTPTGAALAGVNRRLKRAHGPRRPSFIDTGLYTASLKSWIDDPGEIAAPADIEAIQRDLASSA
jgi:hypothetical protein